MDRPDDTAAMRGQRVANATLSDPRGEFVDESLLADCERFLEEARRLSITRKNVIHPSPGIRSLVTKSGVSAPVETVSTRHAGTIARIGSEGGGRGGLGRRPLRPAKAPPASMQPKIRRFGGCFMAEVASGSFGPPSGRRGLPVDQQHRRRRVASQARAAQGFIACDIPLLVAGRLAKVTGTRFET